ncbi:hypothetical protein [Pseudanabaena sp. UWO310]|uniref:hypothetical protein n=1 Tax=Pseudanabaena sp. UWO310 TaxID=2480795 RepID=UPI0021DF48F6|nr:hypothetical protein [Pseudanabaena sp. UWO310]
MLTYSQVEQALIKLGYAPDFDHPSHTKLTALIPIDGYQSPVVLEFREGWKSELGDVAQLLQVEWLMDDRESVLILDINSLEAVDDTPAILAEEKIMLRETFDRILEAISSDAISSNAISSNAISSDAISSDAISSS